MRSKLVIPIGSYLIDCVGAGHGCVGRSWSSRVKVKQVVVFEK